MASFLSMRAEAPPPDSATERRARRFGLAVSATLVALATALALAARAFLALPDLAMIYVAAIVVTAVAYDTRSAVLASVLSIAAYDFLFVQPYYTFAVNDARNVVTFAMMAALGVIISKLVGRGRLHAAEANAAVLRARHEAIRNALLSSVSHDLRTPLAVITGAATTLRDQSDQLAAEAKHELAATICDEADRLERLVGNVLDLSRLETRSIAAKREWVPVEEIVSAAATRSEAMLSGRTVAIRIEPDLPLASVEPLLVEQALINVLDNAAKHGGPDAAITLEARRVSDAIQFVVADSGPGFEPGDEERVFEKGYRGPRATSLGAGLGLTIVRAVADAHGGSVSARNRASGGAEIELTFPIVGAQPPLVAPDFSPRGNA